MTACYFDWEPFLGAGCAGVGVDTLRLGWHARRKKAPDRDAKGGLVLNEKRPRCTAPELTNQSKALSDGRSKGDGKLTYWAQTTSPLKSANALPNLNGISPLSAAKRSV